MFETRDLDPPAQIVHETTRVLQKNPSVGFIAFRIWWNTLSGRHTSVGAEFGESTSIIVEGEWLDPRSLLSVSEQFNNDLVALTARHNDDSCVIEAVIELDPRFHFALEEIGVLHHEVDHSHLKFLVEESQGFLSVVTKSGEIRWTSSEHNDFLDADSDTLSGSHLSEVYGSTFDQERWDTLTDYLDRVGFVNKVITSPPSGGSIEPVATVGVEVGDSILFCSKRIDDTNETENFLPWNICQSVVPV